MIDASGDAFGAAGGIDANGSGWVLWGRNAPTEHQVLARRFSPEGWQNEVLLDEVFWQPSGGLSVRADGSTLALWASTDLHAAVAIGDSFGPAVRIADRVLGDEDHVLAVATGPAGHTVAAWQGEASIWATPVHW